MNAVAECVVPFRAFDRAGQITVESTVNSDPVATGHNLVAGDYDAERFTGFPVVTGRIGFDGTGYRRFFGWLQLITHEYAEPGRPPLTSVDSHPGMEIPLFSFGYLPPFFDAPANPDHPDMRWLAEAFLVRLPEYQTVTPVAGFSWGYDLANGVPNPVPVQPIPVERWNAHLDVLHDSAPGWSFRTYDG